MRSFLVVSYICCLTVCAGYIVHLTRSHVLHHINSYQYLSRLHCNSNFYNPSDDALYNIFWNQISGMSEMSTDESGDSQSSVSTSATSTSTIKRKQQKKVFESYVPVAPGSPLEFIVNKKLTFGNFIEKIPNRDSFRIRTAAGKDVDVAVGQIISTWDVLQDEETPSSPSQWAQIAMDALQILGAMSPRKSDLQEFHRLLAAQRGPALPVDSLDLGVYIFQERSFKSWSNPYSPARDAGVHALSAAQRYTAALLLFYDDFHFKRRQTTLVDVHEGIQDATIDLDSFMSDGVDEESSVLVVEGGYKVLDEGVVSFREGDAFASFYEQRINESDDNAAGSVAVDTSQSPFRAGCVTKQLRAIELYSVSPANAQAPPSVKLLLRRLGFSIDPSGARSLLLRMNHNAASPSVPHAANTPWSDDVLRAAQALANEVQLRRKELATSFSGRAGKRGPSGRMDYRSVSSSRPSICIDSSKASFYDDAFSLSPETGEVLVHVVDVNEYLRRYPLLQKIAQERLASAFLPTGPVHMLPPTALEGIKLSSEMPNEVITVALSINETSGELIGFRVFPSVIGPVVSITQETADEEIMRMHRFEEDGTEDLSSARAGLSMAALSDLFRASKMVEKLIEKQPWIDESFLAGKTVEYSLDRKSGVYRHQDPRKTASNRMVNALLSVYSNASCEFCLSKNISVPIAWENRDKIDSNRISRYATRPLRSWLAQLQQKQLRAALKIEIPLTRKDCALAVTYHSTNKKQLSAFEKKSREIMSFESLEAHCSAMAASGQRVVLSAQGIGRGGEVSINEYRVKGIVGRTISKGEAVMVLVKKVHPETKSVMLELSE